MGKKKIAIAPETGKKGVPAPKVSVQESRHKQGYVPLWKQWKRSKEGKDYLQNEAPKVKEKMSVTMKQIETDRLEKQRIKERDEQMAKSFQLRWVDSQNGKVQESSHGSEKAAKDKARDLSMANSPVQVGEVDGGKLLQQWSFDKGRQQAMDTKKQVTVAPISKAEASQIQTNETKGHKDMGAKSAKKTSKAGANKTSKATTGAAKAKTQLAAKPGKPDPKKTGTVRDLFGLREGSNREKLVDCLLAAKGKPVAISDLLKAVYGSTKEEGKGPLNMVLKGMGDMIAKNKIKMDIVKAKDDKGVTIALKAK